MDLGGSIFWKNCQKNAKNAKKMTPWVQKSVKISAKTKNLKNPYSNYCSGHIGGPVYHKLGLHYAYIMLTLLGLHYAYIMLAFCLHYAYNMLTLCLYYAHNLLTMCLHYAYIMLTLCCCVNVAVSMQCIYNLYLLLYNLM